MLFSGCLQRKSQSGMRKLNCMQTKREGKLYMRKREQKRSKLFTNIDVNHRTEEAIVSRANKPTVGIVTLGDVARTVYRNIYLWIMRLAQFPLKLGNKVNAIATDLLATTGNMAYSGPMLSPPWYTLQSKFKYTFGCDPAVTVKDLDTSGDPKMVVPIIVDDEKKGTALRTLIRPSFPFGNIIVVTDVKNSKGESWQALIIKDEKQLRDVMTDAYSGNPLFVEAKSKERLPLFPVAQVGLIMTKSVVQFYNDDISDYYSNFNGVTADVMSDLISMSFAGDQVQVLMGTQVSQ